MVGALAMIEEDYSRIATPDIATRDITERPASVLIQPRVEEAKGWFPCGEEDVVDVCQNYRHS